MKEAAASCGTVRLFTGPILLIVTHETLSKIDIKPTGHFKTKSVTSVFFKFLQKSSNCIVPLGFLPWEIRVAFPGENQLRQTRATQPRVHVGCFGVSIIHRTLTWPTGSLTCTQMLMHAIAHDGLRTP